MNKKFLTFAVLATMLASCANNDEPAVVTEGNPPITVTAGVSELSARAGHDSDNLPGTFYLTITQVTDETPKYNYSNVPMAKATDGSNLYAPSNGTDLLWKYSYDKTHPYATVYAYTTDSESFTVETNQKDESGILKADLLGAFKEGVAEPSEDETSEDITISNDNIAIAFRHLLCKLDVTFEWGTEYDGVAKEITSVTYSGFGTACKLNSTEGTIDKGTDTGDIEAYFATTDTGYLSEGIFAPQTLNPVIIIATTIGEDDAAVTKRFQATVTLPAATDNNPEGGFVSGYRYTMTVQVGGTAVNAGTVESAKWETGTVSDQLGTE